MSDIILNVPFDEKNDAKSLGAKFNMRIKKWYVPSGLDSKPFDKWKVTLSTDFDVTIRGPIYLAISSTSCWKCGKETPVYSLATRSLKDFDWSRFMSDFFILCNIHGMEERLIEVFKGIDTYFPDYTKMTNSWYYANHCQHCMAVMGDHFMHSEPQGAFSPVSEYECEDYKLMLLKELNDTYTLDCAFHSDSEGGIFGKYAKSISMEEFQKTLTQNHA